MLNDAKSQYEVWEIWTRDPDTSAFTDLMNRALDKPKEQPFEHNVAVDWDKRIARIRAARRRVGERVEEEIDTEDATTRVPHERRRYRG